MYPTLELGPLVIPTAGLIIILGLWLALSAVERAAARLRLHVPATYTLAVTAVAAGFAGARLVFVALHWRAFSDNLLGIVWPLTSGFHLGAGLLIGVAAAFFYGRWRELPAAATLDAVAPGLLVALMAVSLADFLAGPGYGEQADLPWSISLFGISRHPVQLYEIAVGAAALLAWRWTLRGERFPSRPFLVSAAVYSAGRLITDAYRANAPLTEGGYHVVQIVSLAVLLVTLFFLALFAGREERVAEAPGADAAASDSHFDELLTHPND